MPVCLEKEPLLEPVNGNAAHLQACHLDEQTKEREAAKLLASMTSGAAS
jgi:hypothetical protein